MEHGKVLLGIEQFPNIFTRQDTRDVFDSLPSGDDPRSPPQPSGNPLGDPFLARRSQLEVAEQADQGIILVSQSSIIVDIILRIQPLTHAAGTLRAFTGWEKKTLLVQFTAIAAGCFFVQIHWTAHFWGDPH